MTIFSLFRHTLMDEAAADGAASGAADGAPAVETTTTLPGAKPAPDAAAGAADAGATEDVLSKAGFGVVEGDPGLNYALNFLASNGFTADSPSVNAALNGDFGLLKAELAQKGAAGWEQALGLAEQSYGRHQERIAADNKAVGEVVLGIAEQLGVDWEAAAGHMASAPQEERDAINQLLASPKTAHIAAQFVALNFINNGTGDITPAARAAGEGSQALGALGAAGGPLTRAEFTKQMGELRRKLGDDYLNSTEAQALYARLG